MVPLLCRVRGCDGFTFNELLAAMSSDGRGDELFVEQRVVSRQQTVNSNATVALHLAQDKTRRAASASLAHGCRSVPERGDRGLSANGGTGTSIAVGVFAITARSRSEATRCHCVLARLRIGSNDANRRGFCRDLEGAIRHNQRGVTLIEQLISLLLGAVMITALFGYFRHELYRFVSLEIKTSTLEDSRGALDIMVRDSKMPALGAPGVRRRKPARPTIRR